MDVANADRAKVILNDYSTLIFDDGICVESGLETESSLFSERDDTIEYVMFSTHTLHANSENSHKRFCSTYNMRILSVYSSSIVRVKFTLDVANLILNETFGEIKPPAASEWRAL